MNERQLFISQFRELGYMEHFSDVTASILIGFKLTQDSKCYIGYDESHDKPYYIALASTGKVMYRSYSHKLVCNLLLKFEFIAFDCDHLEGSKFSTPEFIVDVSTTDYQVYTVENHTWLATFARYEHLRSFISGK